jgi:hypothetical protein
MSKMKLVQISLLCFIWLPFGLLLAAPLIKPTWLQARRSNSSATRQQFKSTQEKSQEKSDSGRHEDVRRRTFRSESSHQACQTSEPSSWLSTTPGDHAQQCRHELSEEKKTKEKE